MSIKVKRISLFLSLTAFVLALMLLFIHFYPQAASAIENENTAASLIKTLINDADCNNISKTDAAPYESAFKENLTVWENGDYIFLFDEKSLNMKAIILNNLPESPLFGKISSKTSAIDAVQSFAMEAVPAFFTENSYDTICRQSGEPGKIAYTVEFWERISDAFYTGNKISAIVSEDGNLHSFSNRSSNSDETIKKYVNGKSIEDIITKNQAIEIAYEELSNTVEQLETEEQKDIPTSPIKTGDDVIVSDFGNIVDSTDAAQEATAYEIYLESREGHSVDAHKELNKGQVLWIVSIDGVETNRAWKLGFFMSINAQTGAVNSIDYTR